MVVDRLVVACLDTPNTLVDINHLSHSCFCYFVAAVSTYKQSLKIKTLKLSRKIAIAFELFRNLRRDVDFGDEAKRQKIMGLTGKLLMRMKTV